jgi:homotetrameric cytidine deaminase
MTARKGRKDSDDAGLDELLEAARTARQHAYAPYSRFLVGVAVRLKDGRVTRGVNVENASFGLTVCAERHAIAAAVLEGAVPGDVVAVAIAADAEVPTPPCGACRQVLAEMCVPEAPVVMLNLRDGKVSRLELRELLPHAFTRGSLPA